MRAGLYARVSTSDQRPDAQLDVLRAHAGARGWTVAGEFVDHGISGARQRRPALDTIMAAARRREIDIVAVAAFDRFARSVPHLLAALEEFRALGVEFVSLREQIDTATPLGRMVFTLVAAVAELERELIRERVRAGIAAARKRGQHIGRPRRFVDIVRARHLMEHGKSLRRTARVIGVSPSVLSRALRTRASAASEDEWAQEAPDGQPGGEARATTQRAHSGAAVFASSGAHGVDRVPGPLPPGVPETPETGTSVDPQNPTDPHPPDRPCRKE